jgi:hypothetical protein
VWEHGFWSWLGQLESVEDIPPERCPLGIVTDAGTCDVSEDALGFFHHGELAKPRGLDVA